VLASVRRTGRVVIVHEAPRTSGFGAELAALVAERALTSLLAPVLRVTGYDTPFPYTLEHSYLPDAKRVFASLEHVMSY
jgi:pyruvate/2-oxoglutarate/acetoin dehydrogenase E1 component